MLEVLKKVFCNHDGVITKTITSVREGDDNLVESKVHFKCKKCKHYASYIEKVDVEKDYYKGGK